jgi:cysteine desulfurase
VDVQAMNIYAMSISAHKIYGPKGIGALYRRRSNPRVKLEPRIYGGGHERGIRSGTLNVPAIVGFGKALEISSLEMESDAARFRTWTQQISRSLEEELEGIHLNGHTTRRLPNNLNVSLPGIDAKLLVMNLRDVVALSTGSACTSASPEPSHVILALGFGQERARCAIRIGVGRFNSDEQIDLVKDRMAVVAHQLHVLGSA